MRMCGFIESFHKTGESQADQRVSVHRDLHYSRHASKLKIKQQKIKQQYVYAK